LTVHKNYEVGQSILPIDSHWLTRGGDDTGQVFICGKANGVTRGRLSAENAGALRGIKRYAAKPKCPCQLDGTGVVATEDGFESLSLSIGYGANALHIAVTLVIKHDNFTRLCSLGIDQLDFIAAKEFERGNTASPNNVALGIGRQGIESGLKNSDRCY
jgi:hypothetical protein